MSIIEYQIRAFSPQLYLQPQPFSNPICKSTYKALPKIYGYPQTTKTKPTNKKESYSFDRPKFITAQNQQVASQKYFHKQNKNSKKQINHSFGLFKYSPTKRIRYSENDSSPEQGRITKNNKGKIKKIKLPELSALKSFQKKQIQSVHKILRTDSNQKATSLVFLNTGLGQLVSHNVNYNTDNIQKKINQLQQLQVNKQKIKQNLAYENSLKRNSGKSAQRRYFDTQSDQKLFYVDRSSNNNFGYNQLYDEDNDMKNRYALFNSNQDIRQSTIFQQNNKKMEYFTNRKRGNSTYSNGLFAIPQESQFQNYIQRYRPLDSQFNLKQLSNSTNFQILKGSKGVYFGEVKEGLRHGNGLYISQRQIFEGKYFNNLKIQGCQRNVDGVYIGQFFNGQRSGIGIFRWNNGQIFEGQWKKGVKDGHGIWTSPKGDYYDGQWLMNRQHGKGIFRHKTSTYKGSFLNFLKHGHGQQKFANGDSYIGEYKQGRPDGKGRYEWSTGGYYEGDFVKGLRQGVGKWVQKNGNIYEGNFVRDCKQGQGQQIFKTGETFVGEYDQGIQKSGIIYAKNGSILKKIQ